MSLFDAVRSRDLAAVKHALTESKDVNELGEDRRTPLIEAASLGLPDIVKALLDAGAEADWRDASQDTALLKAAANGHVRVVGMLLAKASKEDQDMARAFLAAHGKPQDPDFTYDPSRLKVEEEEAEPSALKRRAVELAARAANFVGYESPLERVERQKRAEADKKNKK